MNKPNNIAQNAAYNLRLLEIERRAMRRVKRMGRRLYDQMRRIDPGQHGGGDNSR